MLWRWSFFSKSLKFYGYSRNGLKISETVFGFTDNCIWIRDYNFLEPRARYLPLAVKLLRNTPKISHITKGDISQDRFSPIDAKIWWKCSHSDFTRIWISFKCWLSTGVLKRCFLECGPAKSFTACNFRNKVAMTIIFFLKMLKIWSRLKKWIEKIRKRFSF